MAAWPIYLGLMEFWEHRKGSSELDDPFETDESEFSAVLIGVTIGFGFAALFLGLYLLIA